MPIISDKALQSLPGSLVLHHPLTALHLVRNSFKEFTPWEMELQSNPSSLEPLGRL